MIHDIDSSCRDLHVMQDTVITGGYFVRSEL